MTQSPAFFHELFQHLGSVLEIPPETLGKMYPSTDLCTPPARLSALPTVALSVRQPWAWLIVHGYKDLENRTWHTRHRGPTLLHTGLRIDKHGARWIRHHFPEIPLPALHLLPTGGIVGQVVITDCVRPHESPWYAAGQWAFTLTNAEPLPWVPLSGMRNFFAVSDTVRLAVHQRQQGAA